MPTRKPLLIQSGRQPFELVFLFVFVLTGLAGLLTHDASPTIREVLNGNAWMWNAGVLGGGLLTLVGVWMPVPLSLLIERVGLVWLSVLFFAYGTAILVRWDGRAVTSAAIVLGIALATTARVVQISRDLGRLKKAIANPNLASDPHLLAEPIRGDADNGT